MSITFRAELRDTDFAGFRIHCLDVEDSGHEATEPNRDHDAVTAEFFARKQRGEVCDWCGITTSYTVDDSFDVNMSNGNARDVLEALGLIVDNEMPWCGDIAPDDLVGRVLIARAVAPDPALASYELTGERGARLVFAGRQAGYVNEKLDRLQRLAEVCAAMGRRIQWC